MPAGVYARTKEHCENISKAHKAQGENHWMKRPESREKLRVSNLGRVGYWTGKKRDDPMYLERQSIAHKGQHSSPATEFKPKPGTVKQGAGYWKEYREKNKDIIKLKRRQYQATHKEERRASRLVTKLGTDGKDLMATQRGLCAACSVDLMSLATHNRHLDHDHATGVVRGWLCHWCNVIEGQAKGSSAKLRLIADYIDRFKG